MTNVAGGYPQQHGEPGFHAPPPGGYNAQYAPQYAPNYGAPAPQHGYPNQYPGANGYGAPPPQGQHPGSPSPYAPQGQHGYGAPPPPQTPAPVSAVPVRLTFVQKDGYDRSGSIKDAAGKVVYKLKDEADKHAWTAYLTSRVNIFAVLATSIQLTVLFAAVGHLESRRYQSSAFPLEG